MPVCAIEDTPPSYGMMQETKAHNECHHEESPTTASKMTIVESSTTPTINKGSTHQYQYDDPSFTTPNSKVATTTNVWEQHIGGEGGITTATNFARATTQ